MKTAVVLINGDLSTFPDLSKLVATNDLLICADGAADQAYKQKIIPDVIVGDLDSIDQKVKKYFISKNVRVEMYPKEKDYTDSEIAVQYALKQHIDKLIICGIVGSRVDHQLSNIFFLSKIARNIECVIIEGNSSMHFVYDELNMKGSIGDELSLIPLVDNSISVATEGLKYSLNNEDLLFAGTRGISNIFEKKQIKVTLKQGVLLAIHYRKH